MSFQGPEKMDEDATTKDRFAVPSPPILDSKKSFVGSIQSKQGHQTTSTPYVGAFQASGGVNLKRTYDSGCDPTVIWDTPISRAPHTATFCGHQSFDTLSDTEPHVDGPHPQLNLLPCFEERVEAEELPTIRAADPVDLSIWRDQHPTQKRRSLDCGKSPSPYRNKRHSLDLSNDSGCFSTQTVRSDSHSSSSLLSYPLFVPLAMEETTGKSTLPGLESVRGLPATSALSERYFASERKSLLSHDNTGCHVSRSSDSFLSNLTPTIGGKVSRLQLVLTSDSGCSVTSMDSSGEPARDLHSNSTPSFGEKPFKLHPVLHVDSIDACSQPARGFPLSFAERVSELQPGLPCESAFGETEISEQSSHDIHSKSTLKLQPADSERCLSVLDHGEISAVCSKSMHPFDNACDSRCRFNSADAISVSQSILTETGSHRVDSLTCVKKTRLEMTDASKVPCDIPLAVKRCRTQTFQERLATRKMRLDQEIGLRIGKRYVDIIRELGRKMFTEPLSKVFGYLSEEELCSLCLVSSHWKKAVELETSARLRRRRYIQENRQRIANTPQENRTKLTNPARLQNFTNPNKPMAQIQTVEELPTARPIAPTPLTKAEEFFKEARSLDRTESLRKCPKCDSPARTSEKDKRARCTRAKCRYEFCVYCRKLFHGGSDCSALVRNPAPTKIGSSQSKQNLRRL